MPEAHLYMYNIQKLQVLHSLPNPPLLNFKGLSKLWKRHSKNDMVWSYVGPSTDFHIRAFQFKGSKMVFQLTVLQTQAASFISSMGDWCRLAQGGTSSWSPTGVGGAQQPNRQPRKRHQQTRSATGACAPHAFPCVTYDVKQSYFLLKHRH